jgi:AraC-like DNA-binding protein
VLYHHFPKKHTKDFTGDEIVETGPGFWEHIWYNLLDAEKFKKIPLTLMHSGYSYWLAGRKIHREKGDFWSIETVCAGNLVFEQNDKQYLIGPGDSFIQRKACEQTYYTGPAGHVLKRFIRIEGPMLDHMLEFLHIDQLDILLSGACKGISRLLKQATILQRIKKEDMSMQMALFSMQLLMTIAASTGNHKVPEGLAHSIETMEKNLNRIIATPDLAKTAGMSVPQYYRIFKNHFGKAPLDYFLHLKMERARYLLTATELSIKEIAWTLGYTDPSYFSRSFSRMTGVSAKKYRHAGLKIWV